MIVKVPMHPAVVRFIESQNGLPLKYKYEEHISMIVFSNFCVKKIADPKLIPGSSFLEILLTNKMINAGCTYIHPDNCKLVEKVFLDILKNKLCEDVHRYVLAGSKFKTAILLARNKYKLEEDDLAYATLWKRVQRLRVELEAAQNQNVETFS